MGRGGGPQRPETQRVRAVDSRPVQVPRICAGGLSVGADRRRSGTPFPADPRSLSLRLDTDTYRGDEPFRRTTALRGAENPIHHAGVDPAALLRRVYQPAKSAAFFPR